MNQLQPVIENNKFKRSAKFILIRPFLIGLSTNLNSKEFNNHGWIQKDIQVNI